MKREEFIEALRSRLNRLPAEELESALDYYNEIFLDAGEENEEQTAESLGSIDDIARQIYAENGIEPDGRPTFIVDELKEQSENRNVPPFRQNYTVRQEAPFSAGKLIAFILLFPVWFPLLIVMFVLVFVVFIIGFVFEISIISAGFGLFVSGIVSMFSVPPLGLVSIGIGLVLLGVFGLTFRAVFKGSIKVFVGALNSLVSVMHKIFVGGEANA